MLWRPRAIAHRQALTAQWAALGSALQCATPAWQAEGAQLLRHWSRWPRAYHDTTHLWACLQHLAKVQSLAPQALQSPEAAALALWYHDAVYWPWSPRNEERSAEMAARTLQRHGLPGALAHTVTSLILDTRHHADALMGDSAWVVDMDLAILGQNPDVYARFESNVRREYFFVPARRYAEGRSAVLQGFLARNRIYHTALFQDRYEQQARINLAGALQALRHA